MSFTVEAPFPFFPEADGTPGDNLKIYIGEKGLDAEANPVVAYWDAELTITADQPIRTIAGFMVRSGSPATVFTEDEYSITVRADDDTLVFSSTGGGEDFTPASVGLTGTGADQTAALQSALDSGATVDISGTVLVSSTGSAFTWGTSAADLACVKIGDNTIDDTKVVRIISSDRTGVIKAMTADGDACPLVIENIGEVYIGPGLTFDGNLAVDSAGTAHGFVIAGCKKVFVHPETVCQNYRTSRVCGTPVSAQARRTRGRLSFRGNINPSNATGSASFFVGKPYWGGICHILEAVSLDGRDGTGRGGMTIDNDSQTATGYQFTPTSVTSSGTTVTVNFVGHGYSVGDYVRLSGADQGQYNQMGLVTTAGADSFTFEANKTPSATPATGTLVLRPCGGPIRAYVHRSILRNTASDSSQFAIKFEDGVEWFDILGAEADSVDEVSASTSLGVIRIAPGDADWPMQFGNVRQAYGRKTYFGSDIILGRADYEFIGVDMTVGNDMGLGLNVSPQNDIQDHGVIDRLSVKTHLSGKWDGNDRSLAAVITNADSGENIVNALDLEIPTHSAGGAGLYAIKGVGRVNIKLGTIKGGFVIENSNPNSSGSFVQQVGAGSIAGATDIFIEGGYCDYGGRDLSSGKPGSGMELHATRYIKISNHIFDGGTGNDQIGGPLIRLSVLETPADMTTLCTVILEGCVFRNASEGINLDDVTGVPSGMGYKLILRDCIFESSVTTDVANISRFESVTEDGTVRT